MNRSAIGCGGQPSPGESVVGSGYDGYYPNRRTRDQGGALTIKQMVDYMKANESAMRAVCIVAAF